MKLIQYFIFAFFIANSNTTVAQQMGDSVLVGGVIISAAEKLSISNTHVINKRTYHGTISNGNGRFITHGRVGDTLVFSNIGYQFFYYQITGKEGDSLRIAMQTRNYLLDEVSVAAYKLTSNDPKPMVVGEPMIPKTENIRTPEAIAPTLGSPIDYLYYMFSRRANQMETLRQLQAQDRYKEKLKEGNNREILVRMTGMPREELEGFLFYCKYSNTQISTFNDYQLLQTLMQCYDEYQRDKAVNKILDEGESDGKNQIQRSRFGD